MHSTIAVEGMGLTSRTQRQLAVVLGDVLGESAEVSQDVAAFLDAYLRRVPRRVAIGLRLVIWAIMWLPLVFLGRPAPAHALSGGVRARYLAAWAQSPAYLVREAFFLFKAAALIGWGSLARVRTRIGVEPLLAKRS
jgi:hypothetical protein